MCPPEGSETGRGGSALSAHSSTCGERWAKMYYGAERRRVFLGSILDVEASHLALSKTENVSDHLVFKPVRLPLERFAFEIADGLPDFCDDRAIRSSTKAHRLDVRTDQGPLARPVFANCFAPMNVATIHTVGPGDIIGEHGQQRRQCPAR